MTGFIGRADEQRLLRAALADLDGGSGGVAWIEGGPGIGKSALLAEVLGEFGAFGGADPAEVRARARWSPST